MVIHILKWLKSPGIRNIATNFSWLVGERGVSLFVSLTVGIWLARYLGPRQFGMLNYAISFVGLFGTFTYLGLSGIVVRDLVEESEAKAIIVGTAFWLKLVGGGLAISTVAILSLWFDNDSDRHSLVLIIAAGLLLDSFTVIAYWFESRVDSQYKVKAVSLALLISASLKCLLIVLGASVAAFAIVITTQKILSSGFLIWVYRRQGEAISSWTFQWGRAKHLLTQSWPLILSSIGSVIYFKIDQVMLGHLVGSQEVGIYAVAARISEVWYFVPVAVASSFFPKIIQFKLLDVKEYHERMQKLYDLTALSGLIVAVIVSLLSGPLISLLFGSEYFGAKTILAIHVWTCPAVFMGAILSKWLISERLLIFSFTRHGFGAVVNIVLNIILIPKYGGVGAAVATLISYTCAAYLACFTDSRTRHVGWMMTRALFTPHRIFKR